MRDTSPRPRRDVYAELLVTVGLFAIPAALNAVYAYVAGELHYGTVGIGWLFASRAAQELLLIGLFFYVLRANGEPLSDFTKPAQWGDVPRTVGLLLASWLPYVLVMAALWWWTPLLQQGRTNMELFRSRLSVPYLALLLANPFCEELWMRAFLQTRLGQLGWRAPLIVLTSASAQAAYHLSTTRERAGCGRWSGSTSSRTCRLASCTRRCASRRSVGPAPSWGRTADKKRF